MDTLKGGFIAEFAHKEQYGVDIHPLLPKAVQSPLGRLFLRWIALLAEFNELGQKRDRAAQELDDTLMVSLLTRQCKTRLAELASLYKNAISIPSDQMNDVLCKLAMWRIAPQIQGFPTLNRTRLITSVYDDLARLSTDFREHRT